MARKKPESKTKADHEGWALETSTYALFTDEIAEGLESYIVSLSEVEENLAVIWAKVRWLNTQVPKIDCPGWNPSSNTY